MLQLVLLTDLLCGYYHNCSIELKMGGINAIKKIFANLGKNTWTACHYKVTR